MVIASIVGRRQFHVTVLIFSAICSSASLAATSCNSTEGSCDVEAVLLQTSRRINRTATVCHFSMMPAEAGSPLFGTCRDGPDGSGHTYYILGDAMAQRIPPIPPVEVSLEETTPAMRDAIADSDSPWKVHGAPLWRIVEFSLVGTSETGLTKSGALHQLQGSWVYEKNNKKFVVTGDSATFQGREYTMTEWTRGRFKISNKFGGGWGTVFPDSIVFKNGVEFKKMREMRGITNGMYYTVDSESGKATPFCLIENQHLKLENGDVYNISVPALDGSFQLSGGKALVGGTYHHEPADKGSHVTKDVLKFGGRTVYRGPDLTGRWESDGQVMHISFSTARLSPGNVLLDFGLSNLSKSRIEFSSAELGVDEAHHLIETCPPPTSEGGDAADNAEQYQGGSLDAELRSKATIYFTDGRVYERVHLHTLVDGMYYKGASPFALLSGKSLTTADQKVHAISSALGGRMNFSDGFGGGEAQYTYSSISLFNGDVLTLGSNLNGKWLHKGKPLVELSFGSIVYRDKIQATFTVPRQFEMSVSNNFGRGQAKYKELYSGDEIAFANGVVITRDSTTRTTTSSPPPNEMTVLMVICEFSDAAPDYITEASAIAGLFDEPGSVSHLIKNASYGRMIIPRKKSHAITVKMDRSWSDINDCPYQELGDLAMKKVQQQLGDALKPSDFTFREFFLPRKPSAGGCKWWGLSNIGCGYPNLLRHPRATCNIYHTRGFPYARSFEFGRSFGLGDAGGPVLGKFLENGDRSDIMGSSYALSPYSAPAAYQLGWLRDGPGEVLEWNPNKPGLFAKSLYHLRSLSATELAGQNDAMAVKVHCPFCVPQVSKFASQKGGYMWVSFRGNEEKLEATWQNKVYIHLARPYVSKFYGQGTELWSVLGSGEAYQSNELAVVACSIADGSAMVAIAANEASARKSCK